jgi:hypothetical protein
MYIIYNKMLETWYAIEELKSTIEYECSLYNWTQLAGNSISLFLFLFLFWDDVDLSWIVNAYKIVIPLLLGIVRKNIVIATQYFEGFSPIGLDITCITNTEDIHYIDDLL